MSNYPTSLDDDASLLKVADAFSTKPLVTQLAANALSGDTTLQLVSSAPASGGPTSYGVVSIDDEQIIYSGVSGNNLTGCTRGAFGTTAAGHSTGASVRWRLVAGILKALKDAIIAIETALGANLANVTAAPAGSSGDVQINDGGVLGADHNKLVWDKTNHRLGIGTGSPAYSQQIKENGKVPILAIFGEWDVDTMNAQLLMRSYSGTHTNLGMILAGRAIRGTEASPTATKANDLLVLFSGGGYTNALTGAQAEFRLRAVSDWSSTNAETELSLLLTANGSTTEREVLRIHSDGTLEVKETGIKFPDGSTQSTAAGGVLNMGFLFCTPTDVITLPQSSGQGIGWGVFSGTGVTINGSDTRLVEANWSGFYLFHVHAKVSMAGAGTISLTAWVNSSPIYQSQVNASGSGNFHIDITCQPLLTEGDTVMFTVEQSNASSGSLLNGTGPCETWMDVQSIYP